ncbi:MAG: glycosyltransferase family 2 protein [Polyangiales bacterium]
MDRPTVTDPPSVAADRSRVPRVSVVVPAYNATATLESCLSAIRGSRFEDFELVVVDDGSTDGTGDVARRFTSNVVTHPQNKGLPRTRLTGIGAARGAILVFVDSDVVIGVDAIERIHALMERDAEVAAVTGLLSCTTPIGGYLAAYKNIYMNHTFRRLPERVSFLYGSIFAVRAAVLRSIPPEFFTSTFFAEDTSLGQELFRQGRFMAFDRQLEVIHLKDFTLKSFCRNSFNIPFQWAQLMIRNKAWQQIGRGKTGFAHASNDQMVSLILLGTMVIVIVGGTFGIIPKSALVPLLLVWLWTNRSLLHALYEERGLLFATKGVFVTFLDHAVKAAGVSLGVVSAMLRPPTVGAHPSQVVE